MLEGKRFLPETGMPILKESRAGWWCWRWLPEPFTVPTVIEKSFTTLSAIILLLVERSAIEFCADLRCNPKATN